MAVTFIELIGSVSPGSAGFSYQSAKATLQYLCLAADLEDAITEILGSVKANGTGGLTRVLPSAHPLFPWLYASEITSIVGVGNPGGSPSAAEELLEAPTISDYYWPYPKYKLTVSFTSRPYPVLADETITTESITYKDDDGGNVSTTFPNEPWRFLDWETEPLNEWATAQHGQMAFYRDDAAAPSGNTFPGHPRILMPDGVLKITWFQVPWSFALSSSSKLMAWRGRVNQTTWFGLAAGCLLYESFRAVRYTPPVPKREQVLYSVGFSVSKVCDLQLTFRYTGRTAASAYTPTNANHIAAGHNLEPWLFDRKFYYVGNQSATAGQRVPKYLSAPFALLFKDPDT